MIAPPRQLVLDWAHPPSFAREDFLPAPSNREALNAIERWPDWPGRLLLVLGPEGAGKSHLGAIWAKTAGAGTIHASSLGDNNIANIADPPQRPALLIEDADRVGRGERLLFHLINAALQTRAWVLLTARRPPDVWGLTIADLLSRLRLAPIVQLGTPDAELIEAVLFKLFSDRQLQVEPHVVAYIAARIDRSLAAARRLVAILDREALARARRVTRGMASESIREMTANDEAP